MFNIGSGHDTIYGFTVFEDMLDLRGTSDGGDEHRAMQVGNDVVFDYGNGDSLTLVNVDLGDLFFYDETEVFV